MDLDQERLHRILDSMREQGFDALLCTAPSSILLLTGYWPIMGASAAVVTAGGEVQIFSPEDEADLARATSGAVCTTFAPAALDHLVDPVQALAEPILAYVRQNALTHAHLGTELGYGVQPASYLTQVLYRSSLVDVLRQAEPNLRISGADAALERLKAAKTPRELYQLRQACVAARSAFEAAEQAIQPGTGEQDIVAAATAAFLRDPANDVFERSSGYFFAMSGPNAAIADAAFARTRTRLVEPRDLVMIHANTSGNGYWTDITRTFTAGGSGPIPERHLAMRTAIAEATAATLASIRPGVSARDVDHAARAVMQTHGFGTQFVHATGHGVGFAAANGDALPRIHPASTDILEVGMTFNVEPAAYFLGYGGMRHCNVVAVTGTGAELLTNF